MKDSFWKNVSFCTERERRSASFGCEGIEDGAKLLRVCEGPQRSHFLKRTVGEEMKV